MTFLNLSLAFGAAACAIPLVIHLLNRSRYQVVPWGAMQLLEPLLRVNRRRIRLEQLLLLAVRMAILAALAFCMAAPVLTGFHALSGDAKTSLVVLLDNSYSMEAGRDDGTNIDSAKREAAKLIGAQPRGSDLSLLMMAGGEVAGSRSPTTNLKRAGDELLELPNGFGGARVVETLEQAVTALARMQNAKRDLVVVSDFQACDWAGDNAAAARQQLERIRELRLPASLTLLRAGVQVLDNVGVESLDVAPSAVGVGQANEIRANLRNWGPTPYPSLQVYLRVDGRDVESSQVDLPAAESAQVVFQHRWEHAGSHLVEVEVDADSLRADNVGQASIDVWENIPVLLVDGDPSPEPLEGETGFLEIALSPFASQFATQFADDEGRPADLLRAKTIAATGLSRERLAEHRVAVLANVSRLTDTQVSSLTAFVREGNSLLVFAGDRIDAAWYNDRLSSGDTRLLPAQFAELKTAPATSNSKQRDRDQRIQLVAHGPDTPAADASASIATEHFDHPALAPFNDARHGNLGQGAILTWYRLNLLPPQTDADDELRMSPSVLARLENGDPLLIEHQCGDGRVILAATACDSSWSNLPARPFFLPLMQRLVTYLATSGLPPRNIAVNETIVSHLPADSVEATLRTPDGESVALTVRQRGGRRSIEFGDTERPGDYQLTSSSGIEHFVARADRRESDLQQLSDGELKELAVSVGARVAASAEDYLRDDARRRYGRDVWRELYWLLLALLIGELLLQQYFTRRRKTSEAPAAIRGARPPSRRGLSQWLTGQWLTGQWLTRRLPRWLARGLGRRCAEAQRRAARR